MKKKSLLAIGLSLSMVMATSVPAFAAISTDNNLNADGAAVTAPGNPGVKQVAGESYNAASITNKTGVNTPGVNDWVAVNDDDAVAKETDLAADINVWAKVVDSGSKIYKVDLAWGAMKFEYNSGSGQWNPTTHKYDSSGGTKGWTEAAYLEGTNNKVNITNHSNNAINADFAYTMNGEKFNKANGLNNVIGNFFVDNAKAVAASKVLTGTYSDTAGTVAPTAVADKMAAPVKLATADAYNDGTADQPVGARTDDVFFAFSGSPDDGVGKTLDTFKKVGVITVTVTPNNDVNLNKPVTIP